MSDQLDADDFPMVLNPDKPMVISAFGAKGTGKSVFNRRIYHSWPFNKLAIDVNGNAEPGEDAEKLTGPLPTAFPQPPTAALGERRRKYRNLHYRADPRSPSYRQDLDLALGVALFPQDQRCLVWAGECGELMPNGKTGPSMHLLLMQNRHYNTTALFDAPRPMHINPLVLAQSNFVAVYELPNPNDRKRIAESIGYPPARFDKECQATWDEGPHWFMLWDQAHRQLWRCAPLPITDDQKGTVSTS